MASVDPRAFGGTRMAFPEDASVFDLSLVDLDQPTSLSPEESRRVLDSIVCWGEENTGPQHMTPAQWETVIGERNRVGRPLEWDEVRLLIEAEDGLNDDR